MLNIFEFIVNYSVQYGCIVISLMLIVYLLYKNKGKIENTSCGADLSRDFKTGDKSLLLQNSGSNKNALLATIRQVFNCGSVEAKSLIDNAPCSLIEGISDEEAQNIKTALEFVGASIEIK